MANQAILIGNARGTSDVNNWVRGRIIDGFPQTTARHKANVSTSPIETGEQVADHAVALPTSITVQGHITDQESESRPRIAWDNIRRQSGGVMPVTVVTPWHIYPEMIITEATATQQGAGLVITLKLTEVLRVGVRSVPTTAGEATPLGTDPSGPAAERTDNQQRGNVLSPEAALTFADAAESAAHYRYQQWAGLPPDAFIIPAKPESRSFIAPYHGGGPGDQSSPFVAPTPTYQGRSPSLPTRRYLEQPYNALTPEQRRRAEALGFTPMGIVTLVRDPGRAGD